MRALIVGWILVACMSTGLARRAPWRPGQTHTYRSPGGRHAITITFVKDPNTGPCRATLLQGKKVIWKRSWPATPGAVTVAEDGQYFCALNYSTYDEGWFRSVSFYGSKGELLREIAFNDTDPAKSKHPRACQLEKSTAIIRYDTAKGSFTAVYALPAGTLVRETKNTADRRSTPPAPAAAPFERRRVLRSAREAGASQSTPGRGKIISVYNHGGVSWLHIEVGDLVVRPGQAGTVLEGETDKPLAGGQLTVTKAAPVAGRAYVVARTPLQGLGNHRWVRFDPR